MRAVRSLAGACMVALLLVGGADAATTRLDRRGTIVLDGRKVFPIALAKGPPADGLPEVAPAGVNLLKIGPASSWTDEEISNAITWNREAAATGLYTWINLSPLSRAQPGGWREELLRHVVGSLEADPSASAIAMWKGAEEPRRYRAPASSLRFAYCLATGRGPRSWCAGRAPIDSEHLWVTIQAPRAPGATLEPYGAVTDIHGVNSYPIAIGDPNPNLGEVGWWTNVLRFASPRRSLWTTLQICWTWSYDAAGNVALPTRAQERYMIYDAILNGARALAFYGGHNPKCWGQLDALGGWNWTFWGTVLEPLIREIGAGSPIAPALVNPASTRVLESSDGTVQAISRRGAGGELWVVAARSGEGREPVTISGLPAAAAAGSVYTEGRAIAAAGGAFTDTFGRWDVHVYRFPVAPARF